MRPIMALLLAELYLCEPPPCTEPWRNLRSESIADAAGLTVSHMDALTNSVADYFASL